MPGRKWQDEAYPVPKPQILDTSKFADDSSNLDENGRKFFNRVENTVGKGEIARFQHFLLFPQCFQKTYTLQTNKTGLVWEGVKVFFFPIFFHTLIRIKSDFLLFEKKIQYLSVSTV